MNMLMKWFRPDPPQQAPLSRKKSPLSDAARKMQIAKTEKERASKAKAIA